MNKIAQKLHNLWDSGELYVGFRKPLAIKAAEEIERLEQENICLKEAVVNGHKACRLLYEHTDKKLYDKQDWHNIVTYIDLVDKYLNS